MTVPPKGRLRTLLVYAQSGANQTLSYQHGWPRHFQAHPRFAVTPLNVGDLSRAARVTTPVSLRVQRFDLVVVLHSVFSNSCLLSGVMLDAVRGIKAKKAWFIGNEYKLMPEKMEFGHALGVDLFVTQSDHPRVHELYRQRLGCAVTGIPNTGLDPDLFPPGPPRRERAIDLGYRAMEAPLYLGHDERTRLADVFRAEAPRLGLRVDISTDADDRMAEPQWAAFLGRCRGQLGSEAGGDYFELDDRSRLAVNAYLADNPKATPAQVFARFFRDYADPVPMRILSGRNVEAAGTRTVQLLMDGHYGGYLRADEHFIPLRRDLTNVDEAVAKLRDDTLCERLTDAAYTVAREQLTYSRLIDRFHDAVLPLL